MQHFAVAFPATGTGFVGLTNGAHGQRVLLGMTQWLLGERLAAFHWLGL